MFSYSRREKRDKNLFPSGAGSNRKKKSISVYTGRRLGEPIWVSSCRNGKLRAVAQMAQVFSSALRWEIVRGGRMKTLDSKERAMRNVVSCLQPSTQIIFGSKPKRTWPGKLESNSVADHFKWSEEMHLVLMRWARNRYIIQQYSKNIPRKATANKNKIPHAIL